MINHIVAYSTRNKASNDSLLILKAVIFVKFLVKLSFFAKQLTILWLKNMTEKKILETKFTLLRIYVNLKEIYFQVKKP